MTCIHQLVFAIYPLSRRNQMHSLRKTINTGYAFCVFVGVMRTLFFRDIVCYSPSLSYRWLLCNMICCEVDLSSFFSLSFFPPIFFLMAQLKLEEGENLILGLFQYHFTLPCCDIQVVFDFLCVCVCLVYFFLLVSHLFFSPQKLFNVSVVFLNHSGVPDYVPAVIRVLFIDCVRWCDFVPLLQLFILILFFMLYCHSAKHSGSVIINLMHMDASRTTKEVEAGADSCAD